MKETEKRRSIKVGDDISSVSTVAYWYKHGHFTSEEEAQGAFKLAYQQGLDGMGKSIQEWMGLTDTEFDAWMRYDSLPTKKHVGWVDERKPSK